MAVRSGREFIEGLRRTPREVWIAGRRIDDVAADPVFARPVQAIADRSTTCRCRPSIATP